MRIGNTSILLAEKQKHWWMQNMLIFALWLFTVSINAQTTLRIINATSKKVAINDGGFFDKNAWTLSPKARPDIYTADRARKTKWVAFILI